MEEDSLVILLETKRRSGGGELVEGSVYKDRSTGKIVAAFVEAAGGLPLLVFVNVIVILQLIANSNLGM